MPSRYPKVTEANSVRQLHKFCTAPTQRDHTTPGQRGGNKGDRAREEKRESILSTLASRGVASSSTVAAVPVPVPVTLRLPVKRTANYWFTSEGFAV
jgi:hypothetical protein